MKEKEKEADFLGRGIDWIQNDFGRWRVAAGKPLAAQVREMNWGDDLHSAAVILERIHRQKMEMRQLFEPDSDLWVRMVRNWAGARHLLAQVSFFGGDPWPFAVVTTTEGGQAQSHVLVSIPYARRHKAENTLSKNASQFLTPSRMIAIAHYAETYKNRFYDPRSLGVTIALGRGRTDASYPSGTYDLHLLLIREMLGWAYRRQQHLQESVAA